MTDTTVTEALARLSAVVQAAEAAFPKLIKERDDALAQVATLPANGDALAAKDAEIASLTASLAAKTAEAESLTADKAAAAAEIAAISDELAAKTPA